MTHSMFSSAFSTFFSGSAGLLGFFGAGLTSAIGGSISFFGATAGASGSTNTAPQPGHESASKLTRVLQAGHWNMSTPSSANMTPHFGHWVAVASIEVPHCGHSKYSTSATPGATLVSASGPASGTGSGVGAGLGSGTAEISVRGGGDGICRTGSTRGCGGASCAS